MDNAVIVNLAKEFDIKGNPIAAKGFGSGHINDTYRIFTDNSLEPDYLFQRINHHVFRDVDALMQNIHLVTEHLKSKKVTTLDLIPTKKGEFYYVDDTGSYWRAFILIDQTKSYDIVDTETQAKQGGTAFGEFQLLLSDLDSNKIKATIPDFCNIEFRLRNFKKAVENDVFFRKSGAYAEIEYVLERTDKMSTILRMAEKGEIPERITHNDTKFNNILFDENDNAQCVIDLDTVMPGYVAYDFGDAIRTIINSAAEDEADLDKITLNIPLFKAYTEGYFETANQFLTPKEIESLVEGALLFPYMQGTRFLTDHLEGDTYFKIHHENHNLQRARAQLKLAFEVEKNQEELRSIVFSIANLYS